MKEEEEEEEEEQQKVMSLLLGVTGFDFGWTRRKRSVRIAR